MGAESATEIPNETVCSICCVAEVTEWEQREYFELF
jgi:hypothetical protein